MELISKCTNPQCGADGYSTTSNEQTMPTYASFATEKQDNWTWTEITADPRALLSGNSSGRLATTWYKNTAFSFDLNLTDEKSHQIALYALDWNLHRERSAALLCQTTWTCESASGDSAS